MTISSLKTELIGEILQLKDENVLQQIKQYISDKKSKIQMSRKVSAERRTRNLPADLKRHVKSLAVTTDFDAILREQNYRTIDRIAFDKVVDELNIQEPLADLIKMI